jgi:hypothetical protein
VSRPRNDPQADAESATINQLLTLRDSCNLFDKGNDHQFISMAVSLRSLCHDGTSGSLLNTIREKGRVFPSSVHRNFLDIDTAASDHFVVAQIAGNTPRILPRLELTRAQMKQMKFKNWWRETIITDKGKRAISRGGIVLAVANSDGGTHFTIDVDGLYDDLARCNGLGLLFAKEQGSWRTFGLAPIQATMRQIAHEFLLGMSDWIEQRRSDWVYTPKATEITGFAISPGMKVNVTPA